MESVVIDYCFADEGKKLARVASTDRLLAHFINSFQSSRVPVRLLCFFLFLLPGFALASLRGLSLVERLFAREALGQERRAWALQEKSLIVRAAAADALFSLGRHRLLLLNSPPRSPPFLSLFLFLSLLAGSVRNNTSICSHGPHALEGKRDELLGSPLQAIAAVLAQDDRR